MSARREHKRMDQAETLGFVRAHFEALEARASTPQEKALYALLGRLMPEFLQWRAEWPGLGGEYSTIVVKAVASITSEVVANEFGADPAAMRDINELLASFFAAYLERHTRELEEVLNSGAPIPAMILPVRQ